MSVFKKGHSKEVIPVGPLYLLPFYYYFKIAFWANTTSSFARRAATTLYFFWVNNTISNTKWCVKQAESLENTKDMHVENDDVVEAKDATL